MTTAIAVRHAEPKKQKFAVTFFTKDCEPSGLPDFPYHVEGCVLNHTEITAFIFASDPQDASFHVSNYFDVVQVMTVVEGFPQIDRLAEKRELRGTVTQRYTRSSLFDFFR